MITINHKMLYPSPPKLKIMDGEFRAFLLNDNQVVEKEYSFQHIDKKSIFIRIILLKLDHQK